MARQLIVDSCCDIPESVINKYNVLVLPTTLEVDGKKILEARESENFHLFYAKDQLKFKSIKKNRTRISQPEDRNIFRRHIKSCFNNGAKETLILSVSKRYSKSFVMLDSSVSKLRNEHNFVIKNINTKTWLSGQGLIALHALALMNNSEIEFNAISRSIENLSNEVQTYLIPGDLRVVRETIDGQASKSGRPSWFTTRLATATKSRTLMLFTKDTDQVIEKSVRSVNGAIDKVVDRLEKVIRPNRKYGGLSSPYVVVTAATQNLEEVTQLAAMNRLKNLCESAKIKLVVDKMGIPGGVISGMGSISVAFASKSLYK